MNNKKKYTIIIVMALVLTLSLSLTIAAGKQWYDSANLPSASIDSATLAKVVQEEKVTAWFSNKVWKDGNCYYFDLTLSNSTNITWHDPRREITCKPGVTPSDVNDMQLANVQWTILQMNPQEVVVVSETTIQNIGEDLKTKERISSKTLAMEPDVGEIITEESVMAVK